MKETISVLIIDDDPVVLKSLVRLLKESRYEVFQAKDGRSGLELLRNQPLHVALIDLSLPDIHGLDILRRIDIEGIEVTPIVLTGEGGIADAVTAMKLGAFEFIQKPYRPDMFSLTIDKAARHQEALRHSKSMECLAKEWEQVFEATPDCIVVLDKDQRVLKCNKSFLSAIRKQKEEVIGHRCVEIFPPAYCETLKQKIEESQQGEVPSAYCCLVFDRTYEVVHVPLVDDRREVLGLVSVYHDVTQQKEAEKNLRDSEQRYRELVNSSVDAVISIDNDLTITLWNPAAEEIFGYSAEEIIGENLMKIVPERYREAKRKAFARFQEKGLGPVIGQVVELAGLRKDGTEIPIEISVAKGNTSTGPAAVGIIRDISERVSALEKEREAQEKYQILYEGTSAAVMLLDDKTFFDCNEATLEIFGCESRDDFCGRSPVDFSPEFQPDGRASRESAEQHIKEAFDEGSCRFEWVHSRKDGTLFPAEVFLSAVEMGGKNLLAAIVQDITERKAAERELKFARLSLEHASDSVLWVDRNANFVYVNDAACRILGYTREEMLGMTVHDIDPIFTKKIWPGHWEEIVEKGSFTIQTKHRKKDGTIFPVEILLTLVEIGEEQYNCATARDISERLLMESDLRQAQKLESIGQLAAGIAHEINTPTQYVGDNTRFLEESFRQVLDALESYRKGLEKAKSGSLTADQISKIEQTIEECDLEYLTEEIPNAIEQTLEGVDRISKIVLSMKEFSHPGTTEKTFADINHSILSTVTVCKNEWKYVSDLLTDFDPNLPSVPCYPGDLNQVILNLIINAVHAITDVVKDKPGEKGKITISTRRNGQWVEIRVSDTGTGIPEEVRNRIFDPFFTTKEVGKGTGQGLAIGHSVIVEKHGGTLDLETEVGKGTTFIIRLPISEDCRTDQDEGE